MMDWESLFLFYAAIEWRWTFFVFSSLLAAFHTHFLFCSYFLIYFPTFSPSWFIENRLIERWNINMMLSCWLCFIGFVPFSLLIRLSCLCVSRVLNHIHVISIYIAAVDLIYFDGITFNFAYWHWLCWWWSTYFRQRKREKKRVVNEWTNFMCWHESIFFFLLLCLIFRTVQSILVGNLFGTVCA